MALLAFAATAACGVVLGLDEADAPVADGGGGGSETGAPDGAPATDATVPTEDGEIPDVGEPLPGTDGAADDGAAIPLDAALDGHVAPGCPDAAACERVVFVTSATYSMFDAKNADALCTTLANGVKALPRIKGRPFQAWLSADTKTEPASRFIHGTMRYIRPDGTMIAANWDDLTDGKLSASIFHDEEGNTVFGGTRVWTATAPNGTTSPPDCDQWRLDTAQARGGVVGATGVTWTSYEMTHLACKNLYRFYCFER